MARTLINMPTSAQRGEVIEIRAMIAHPMETGYRPGTDGARVPRELIRRFTCTFDDGASKELVFAAELYAAIAANPYLAFFMKAGASGTLSLVWEGDNGFTQTETMALRVA
jgi:sulfur-oxidizing protein SoxZ